MKINKIFQERISDGVLFLQIYCLSNCNLQSNAPWDFFENFQNKKLFLGATLGGCYCQGKVFMFQKCNHVHAFLYKQHFYKQRQAEIGHGDLKQE